MESTPSAEAELSRAAFYWLFPLGCSVFLTGSALSGWYFGGMSFSKASSASAANLVVGILALTIYSCVNRARTDRYFLVFMPIMPMNCNISVLVRFLLGLAIAGTAAFIIALIERRHEHKDPRARNSNPMADADIDQPFAGATPCR